MDQRRFTAEKRTTHNVLEVVQVLLSHGIRLGNDGNQVDPGSEPLHHLHIKRLDTYPSAWPSRCVKYSLRSSRLDKVKTSVNP